ncbi:MAG: sn-glycerol-3-phosphate ABC transporter ATP-binding protein UgpC [Clostridia bacterium]|nr:sn-glycerol-3-phosphate ABC transporter ATP-binding protein UgpC [Clostridia bacterium]
MAGISLKNISKVYSDGTVAVNDLNLEIENKEFIILVGPSGCGKSTTLRMIAGLEDVTDGELKIGERVVNNIAPKDRNIAMVFQSYALYPHMSVYKNMAFGLELRKVPKDEIERRVTEAARILDIEHLLKRKPKALSGGQRQRVALGRAMVRSPDVFLLDEPLSNLDAKLRTAMRAEITKLHRRLETTFVYVTHDQTEAMTMADRIVVMKDGIVQQVDTPQNLYKSPVNKFVAGFIGSPAMNFVNCTNETVKGKAQLVLADTVIPVENSKLNSKLVSLGEMPLTMGIRPEDLTIDSNYLKNNPDSCITAKVEVAEPMGSETYLYADYFSSKLVSRVYNEDKINVGEEIKLAVKNEKIHLFDRNTGLNILTL